MKEKIKSAIRGAIWDCDLIASRMTLGFAELMWSIMLFWPGDTFGRPTYHHMSLIMTEEMWGIIFLISSYLQFRIVLTGKMQTKFAWYFAGWNFCLWGYTVWSMLASVYPPPAAIGGEIALVMSSFWIWFRPIIKLEYDK